MLYSRPMSFMYHPSTNLALGDPYVPPLSKRPSPGDARAFFDTLILSASGWRGVFGADDDDVGEIVAPEKLYAAARMADVFASWLTEKAGPAPVLALAMDTRPTGPALADAMLRVFMARGVDVRYAFVAAAPEVMAWARRSGSLPQDQPGRLSAFSYISASHNPPGHNGVKFGLTDGGVLPPADAAELAKRLRSGACEAADIERLAALCASVPPADVARAYSSCAQHKRLAMSDYALFAREVAGGSDDLAEQEAALDELSAAVDERDAAVVAEFNGSARCLSIDLDYLANLGLRVKAVNAQPRAFAHRIVPEGASLDQCRDELAAAREHDPGYVLGYVPDCDGDRGNLVVWDDRAGMARSLEAQETFALAVLAELADIERRRLAAGAAPGRVAVACNDATSLRVDAIAAAFGASVFRAETGEANVVGLARRLRTDGWTVRVLGEGSNGGVITHPAGVRDPLNTLTAIMKLLCLPDGPRGPAPFGLWLQISGQTPPEGPPTLADVIASLPGRVSTSVFEDRAALRVKTRDHASLKSAYGRLFAAGWPALAARLGPRLGPVGWRAVMTRGMDELPLEGDFGQSGSGGLKILIGPAGAKPVAFLWMRGSGTEPVFRVMADAPDATTEAILLEAHRDWVMRADALA